ncbi:large ribosomal subunit protein mL52 [Amia ocellicauda]|uniref:large ribosomal subunit protein mL52 n=1 Tax=Amia ocellicauda TaxID=2972642 RepID=UPI0034645DEB|nr:RM52 protein [Amia calva]
MAAPVKTLLRAVLRQPGFRSLSLTAAAPAGSKWRIEHGFARSSTEYGPLTDLPDWSFADGRPAPPLKGQSRRRSEREELARRVVVLSSEMDRGMERWDQKQVETRQRAAKTQSLLLKPKGKLLLKNKK